MKARASALVLHGKNPIAPRRGAVRHAMRKSLTNLLYHIMFATGEQRRALTPRHRIR